jgi:beta-ribofuranosylaminobenzene 5'-phosphate synthase
MHTDGVRRNGGVGFGVNDPLGVVEFEPAAKFDVEDSRSYPLAADEIEALKHTIDDAAGRLSLRRNVRVRIHGDLLTHVGMGSGTAIRLSSLEALLLVNRIELSEKKLVQLSNRGGTSGIGVQTYFHGGMCCDLGVPNRSGSFLPSSKSSACSLPLKLPRASMPQWPMGLYIPNGARPKTQEEELEFFEKVAPLRSVDSFEASYHAIMGVYASVIERDYDRFCASVAAMQETAWKSAERAEYGDVIAHAEKELNAYGVDCLGLSSLGPMLYFFGSDDVVKLILSSDMAARGVLTSTKPSVEGRIVEINDV